MTPIADPTALPTAPRRAHGVVDGRRSTSTGPDGASAEAPSHATVLLGRDDEQRARRRVDLGQRRPHRQQVPVGGRDRLVVAERVVHGKRAGIRVRLEVRQARRAVLRRVQGHFARRDHRVLVTGPGDDDARSADAGPGRSLARVRPRRPHPYGSSADPSAAVTSGDAAWLETHQSWCEARVAPT